MGLRRVRTLTPADLAGLSPCPDCGCGGEGREELDPHARWARASMDRWGLCGVGLGHDTWLLLCPQGSLPEDHPLVTRADASEATHMATLLALHVSHAMRRTGAGKQLVQSVAARLVGRETLMLAAGGRAAHQCATPPSEWLLKIGFEPCTQVNYLPAGAQRLVLRLDRTVTWRSWALPDIVQQLTHWERNPPPEAVGNLSAAQAR
ncbi:hypothetical protein M3G03_00580 [Aestuariimicrobium sp. p3-SID1156]|uniref:hypothetical protein n=1 Tax=Aestuariimicrobium sp. p3-SID1156 TaxID=2916038 RepID=UPI00223C22C7|nr:hypothetical protein [Aestuariimicrobium sp. p3-SID1156]MCT1458051.1 hypothetical protein [Aestuariimicrobium sp. p3-SID1156]